MILPDQLPQRWKKQVAAAVKIARNVAETASAANEMTGQLGEVSTEAAQIDRRAAAVPANASGLSAAVAELKHSPLPVVRTSTAPRCAPRCKGLSGTLVLNGPGWSLPFHVLDEKNGSVWVAFDLDAPTAAARQSYIEQLVRRRAT